MNDQANLLARLRSSRAETDRLFTYLNPSALYDRPIAERHRMIFYLGHLEAFDWNQMKQIGLAPRSPVPEFDNLFAFGIDPQPGQLPSDMPSDWPKLSEVQQYNRGVRDAIDNALPNAPAHIAEMMIEHREMHAETFGYILHNLEHEKKLGPQSQLPRESPVKAEMVTIPGGVALLGRNPESGFGWDNEFRQLVVFVPEFRMTRFKITNGEWLDFMRQTGAAAPHYWFQENGAWQYRGVFQNFPLPLTWPVYITWKQATEYAKFRGLQLPSEAQYDRAAYGGNANHFVGGNLGFSRWDPVPVNADGNTTDAGPVSQLSANGWEWTSTVFAPFPGFEASPSYPGYSANFFDDSHYVLKGAGPLTAPGLVRRSFRNWFRPEYPYVHATFHLVEN